MIDNNGVSFHIFNNCFFLGNCYLKSVISLNSDSSSNFKIGVIKMCRKILTINAPSEIISNKKI